VSGCLALSTHTDTSRLHVQTVTEYERFVCAIHLQIFTHGHCRHRHGYTQRHVYAPSTHRHFPHLGPAPAGYAQNYDSYYTLHYAPPKLQNGRTKRVRGRPPAPCSLPIPFSRMPARFLLPLSSVLLRAPCGPFLPAPPSPPTHLAHLSPISPCRPPPTTLTPRSLDVAVFALLAATKPPPLLSPAASLAPSVGFLDSVDGHKVRVPPWQRATDYERN
jgi:hypothetical protein